MVAPLFVIGIVASVLLVITTGVLTFNILEWFQDNLAWLILVVLIIWFFRNVKLIKSLTKKLTK